MDFENDLDADNAEDDIRATKILSQDLLDLAYLIRNTSLWALREAGIGVWFCGNTTSADKPLTNIDDMLKVRETACLVPNVIAYNTYIRELGKSPCRLVVFDNSFGFRYRDAALIIYTQSPLFCI